MIQFCYIASAITFADASVDQSQSAPQTISATGEQQARVGDDVGCRPGATTDQQARIVGVNMQQRALFRRGLHRFNNMFTFG